ncbi:MAG: type IV secretion system DNA-binding domain-containing protein [Candidatus Pacebacteria bacterium]|nr:type IV secretion system DNA-binding domain-containing protein [Candidatus Paceibacterota bacterium]MCF7862898.1 type IV secretion system DNA-binding domain-containing protein [Candidatus Paceibacterota bacterium]
MPKGNRVQIIKYAPPPPELPIFGKVEPEEVSFIGRTNYVASLEEKKFIFGIKRIDRRRHLYIIGKSGVGKTKLMELFLRQDISYNHGLCLIDPHGDVIDAMLDFIPKERIEDVCIIDPTDINFPISFNPLQNVDPMFKFQLTQGLIEVFQKQFGANWTPRLEHVFRFTCLALLDYPYATMRGMISMLTDRNYRQKVIEYIKDDMVKRFFAIEFADWSEKFDTDAIIPLVNKLGQFLSDPLLRNIFGQKENKVDISELMNKEKIILINLSKGRLGEENSSFLGSIFLTKIKQAGMERASMLEKDRKDFYIYVDEFQNVVTQTFENILSEARKYGLNLTMAHQYVGQIIPKVHQAVLGNCGSIISFRIGGEDAVKMKPEFSPIFDVKDMINLAVTEFYIKMTIDGESYDPFSAETLRILPPTHPSYRKEIEEASRRKYTISKESAANLIAEEEATIIRSAEEKSMIEGNSKSVSATQEVEPMI